jgi:hypothetical protein
MSFLRVFIPVFVVLLLPYYALANFDESIVNEFREDAAKVPQTLIDRGYKNFGKLDLDAFLAEIKDPSKVQITTRGWFSRPENIGSHQLTRSSAQWSHKAGTVRKIELNQDLWPNTPEDVRPVLALHEFLGAFGYQDHDYFLSAAL